MPNTGLKKVVTGLCFKNHYDSRFGWLVGNLSWNFLNKQTFLSDQLVLVLKLWPIEI
jgi:hypothetical protein